MHHLVTDLIDRLKLYTCIFHSTSYFNQHTIYISFHKILVLNKILQKCSRKFTTSKCKIIWSATCHNPQVPLYDIENRTSIPQLLLESIGKINNSLSTKIVSCIKNLIDIGTYPLQVLQSCKSCLDHRISSVPCKPRITIIRLHSTLNAILSQIIFHYIA